MLSRFHASPIGTVLVAIRENEQRAQFVGYATQRYKQIAYVISATLTGFAGVLFAFHHRFASADPTAISFSGELLAMVIIGGMRSLLGPALGALFYILFREYLSIWTPNWLLFFGLLFVGFVVFSPTGARRRLAAHDGAAPREGRRGGGDGGAHDRAGRCRCRHSCAASATAADALLDGAGARQGVRRHPGGRGGEHRGGATVRCTR